MPAVLSNTEPIGKHIPAWKKLGLKLKYAKEEPDLIHHGQRASFEEKKRKKVYSEITPLNPTSAKKPKTQSPKKSTPLRTPAQPKPSSLSPSRSNTPTRADLQRKAVSFTPETKTEDGGGVKHLYNKWLSSHLEVDPNFDPSSSKVSPALKTITPRSITFSPPPGIGSEERSGKRKKSKSTLLRKSKPQSKPSQLLSAATATPRDDLILNYLTAHHQSPSTWKFSKNRQNAVLRSLFSLSSIPPSYNAALLSYLSGLQGQAAISRVRDMALNCLADDAEWLKQLEPSEKDKARRRAEYEAAVERVKVALRLKEELREEKEMDQVWAARYQKRKRAEAVLWSIGEKDSIHENAEPTTPPASTGGQVPTIETGTSSNTPPVPVRAPRKRKNKKRATGVPDDDDTSSSSSSSEYSSSSEDEADRADTELMARLGTVLGRRPICDETSSEEEPSSSSSVEDEDATEEDPDETIDENETEQDPDETMDEDEPVDEDETEEEEEEL